MTEESKELSDLHITTPIVLDEKMSELVLYLYTLCVVSRGMDENTVVDCKTADDVLEFLHWLFCPSHQGDDNDLA